MFLEIDSGSPLPVYEQVILQIKFSIATGAVRPDEMIPSVRELARILAINPNTVARAYRALQTEGIVYTCRGTGLAVSPDGPARCIEDRSQFFKKRIEQLIGEANRSWLSESEIRTMFEETLAAQKEDRK
ncbi:MAG: GntR family transcriptional regulator [Planctomycetia bacterium]|nr:GntR family transcriptional regulator [Planctomycetia bacterium]